MASREHERAALLETFAEACTEIARGLVPNGRRLDWELDKAGFAHFHCPLTGLRAPHMWNGGPRASAWVKGGEVEATCPKCVGSRRDHPDEAAYEDAKAAYTGQVKRAIRWTQDGVTHAAFKTVILRSHLYYSRDFKHAVRRDKFRFEDGRKERGNRNPWRWRSAPLVDGVPGPYESMRADQWLPRHYPEHDKLYDALCWYSIDLFIDPGWDGPLTAETCRFLTDYRVVLVEGEKDADTFNALMEVIGRTDIWATCLCHPNPANLASHHVRLIDGCDVVIIGDADEPGRQQAEHWTGLVWGRAAHVKLVRDQLELTGSADSKDLTDWVAQRIGGMPPPAADEPDDNEHKAWCKWVAKSPMSKATATELINLFASTAPLTEPIGRSTEWRVGMVETQKGGIKADSLHNAEKVWTAHPGLRGRVRTNLRSGDVEVIDPPWGGGLVVGAHRAALACGAWLESAEKLSLATRALEDMLSLDTVAPFHNPLAHLLAEAWDGQPRLDGLFTRYLPLNVEQPVAASLARITLGDLILKMRNALVGQRLLVGIETDVSMDVAGALMGRHGLQQRGRLSDRQVEQFARQEAMLVQISMEPVANWQAALSSLPTIFSPHVFVARRTISSPLFLAVGIKPADPRTEAKVDDKCFLYELAGKPRLEELRDDAGMLVAEAVARIDELVDERVPSKARSLTVDAREAVEAVRHLLEGLHLYVTRDMSGVDVNSVNALLRAPKREKPLRHVVRSQFLQTMRAWMFDSNRDILAQERSFNSACRAMGWVKHGRPVSIILTSKIAAALVYNISGRSQACVMGILMTDERLADLEHKLFGVEPPSPPKGGEGDGADGDEGLGRPLDTLYGPYTGQNPREPVALDSDMEGPPSAKSKDEIRYAPRAHVHVEFL